MAFVNTQPAAISAAATQLEGLANSFAAESSAAASSTTDVFPAGADEVSVLQAGVFSTYGQLYQSVSAQAQAIHQQFVQLLNQSSGSYQDTETANQAGAAANSLSNATGSASSAASSAAPTTLAGLISGLATTLSGSVLSSNIGNLLNINTGNYASAASDMIGVTSGGLLTALSGPAAAASTDIGGLGTALASDAGPAAAAGAGGIGAAPVLASAGAGSSIGPMSVPPSWAGGAGAGIPAGSTPVTLASQSWAAGAPSAGGVPTNGIAGMPAVANGGRGSGSSFGAPRYGVKPKVMPTIAKPS
jgi:PE family protein/PPE family protein